MALADLRTPEVQEYVRRRTGVSVSRPGLPLIRRLLLSKWTWMALGIVAAGTICLVVLLLDIMADAETEDGARIPGLNSDALWTSAERAFPTMMFWIICFVLVDRYKPQRLLVWFLALTWGGSVAIMGSYYINTWVGEQMAVIDEMSGTSAIRLAVFVAPFVEEATKASVIFLIVLIDRNRFTSRASGAVIGGLAGAGFAFFENIIYYARVIVYGSMTAGTGDVAAALDYLVLMRGVLTCFGHPLFTLMTGVGVAFAVVSRSKIVRVIAPVTGYLMAAFLHMFFNWQVSVIPEEQLLPMIMIIAWPVVIGVAIRVIISSVRQGRVVAARLGDYAAMGWLPKNYPAAFSKVRTRIWTVIMSIWHASVIKTWKLQVRATELALLADAITRGTVDGGALGREYDLINEIQALSSTGGLADGRGLRPYWPWNASRHKAAKGYQPFDPSLLVGTAAGATLKYSAVDPRWKPPV